MVDTAVMTGAALMRFIAECLGPGAPQAPLELMYRTIMHESHGVVGAISPRNPNGTIDYGLSSINSSNLLWLGETPKTIMEPCRNIRAEYRIMQAFSSYATGSPQKGFVLRPPGRAVSYVEDMADPRYRDQSNATAVPVQPRKHHRQLISLSTK